MFYSKIKALYEPSKPASICLFQVNNGDFRTMYGICSRLTQKTPEQCHRCRSGVFIITFEQISHVVLLLPFLTLKKYAEWKVLW